jgi:hypothetical protein
MTASTAVFDRSVPRMEELATNSQFSGVVPISYATVALISALRRVEELMRLPDNWDSYGSPHIETAAAQRILQVLLAAQSEYSPAPQIVPVSGGGMQIEWAVGNCELEVEALPDGSVEFLFVEGDRTLEMPLPATQIELFIPTLMSQLCGTEAYAASLR